MIILQQQPTNNTCMCACLAMVLGLPVEQIVEEWHQRFFDVETTGDWFDDALDFYGVEYSYPKRGDNIVPWQSLTFAVVPSLNIQGTLHQILIHTSATDCTIYDPNNGREGKKYYVLGEPKSDDEFKLTSFTTELIVPVLQDYYRSRCK